MKGFVAGILVTLAVLYPTVTKDLWLALWIPLMVWSQAFWIKISDFGHPNIAIMVDIELNIKYNGYCSKVVNFNQLSKAT